MNATIAWKTTAIVMVVMASTLGAAGCSADPAPPSAGDSSVPVTSDPAITSSPTSGNGTEAKDDVQVTGCTKDPSTGLGKATVVVTNSTTGPASYFVGLAFVAGPTKTRYSSGQPKIYPVIEAGQSVTTEFTSTSPLPDEFMCVIEQLTRS